MHKKCERKASQDLLLPQEVITSDGTVQVEMVPLDGVMKIIFEAYLKQLNQKENKI